MSQEQRKVENLRVGRLSPPRDLTGVDDRFLQPVYILKYLGDVTAPDGRLLLYSRRSGRWRAEFTLYTDADRRTPLLQVRAASTVNVGGGYDVTDCATGELLGIVAPLVLRSMLLDTWKAYGPDGTELATLIETDTWRWFLRKFLLGAFLPSRHTLLSASGWPLGRLSGIAFTWWELQHRLELFDAAREQGIDPRLLFVLGLLGARKVWHGERETFR